MAVNDLLQRAVKAFGLGWCPRTIQVSGADWGLDDKPLYLPDGLTIPTWRNGRLVRVKVRRVDPSAIERWGKYGLIRGSATAPAALRLKGIPPVIVVEGELDALLLAQEVGDRIGVIALGSSVNRPDLPLCRALKAARRLFIIPDNDDAGKEMWLWWSKHFPGAERVMPPVGKDVGDLHTSGRSVRDWLMPIIATQTSTGSLLSPTPTHTLSDRQRPAPDGTGVQIDTHAVIRTETGLESFGEALATRAGRRRESDCRASVGPGIDKGIPARESTDSLHAGTVYPASAEQALEALLDLAAKWWGDGLRLMNIKGRCFAFPAMGWKHDDPRVVEADELLDLARPAIQAEPERIDCFFRLAEAKRRVG